MDSLSAPISSDIIKPSLVILSAPQTYELLIVGLVFLGMVFAYRRYYN